MARSQPDNYLKDGKADCILEESPANAALIMPDSLAALSRQDYDKLGRRATLKLDVTIMPILLIMYTLNYLDRQNLASAKLANIEEDLALSPVQYQTTISILFIGYISMQIPSNMLAARIKWVGTYLCAGMAVWGGLSAVMASVHNFAGLVVARIFIGVVECIYFPGAILLLSMFYNRKQFAMRASILYTGSQLGNAFGGIFAVAILELDGAHGIEGWRWLFLVEGVITTGLAIAFAFILPNSNERVVGMSKLELEWVQWNFASDQGQEDSGDEMGALKGLTMAALDPKTWLLMGTLYCCNIVEAVANFFPSVVGGLGYDRNTTYLLTAPPFVLCIVIMLLNGWHSDHTRERFYHIVGPLLLAVIANIIAVSTLNIGARYTAMMLLPSSFMAPAPVIFSWITGSLSQPRAKRASAIALVNSICNTPNIWCSYIYIGGPRFLTAFIVNLIAAGSSISFAVATRFYLRVQNSRLERGEATGKHGPTEAQVATGFRYQL